MVRPSRLQGRAVRGAAELRVDGLLKVLGKGPRRIGDALAIDARGTGGRQWTWHFFTTGRAH